jgi:hypothetical protein
MSSVSLAMLLLTVHRFTTFLVFFFLIFLLLLLPIYSILRK